MTEEEIERLLALIELPRKRHAAWTATHADECHQVFDALPELVNTQLLYEGTANMLNDCMHELDRYKEALKVAREALVQIANTVEGDSDTVFAILRRVLGSPLNGDGEIDFILSGEDSA